MTRFDETVQKLARQPQKLALLRHSGLPYQKTAGFFDSMSAYASYPGAKGLGHDLVAEFGKGVAGAAAQGLTNYVGGKIFGSGESSTARNDARFKELGKLDAQNKHRAAMLQQLGPAHSAMLGQIGNDEILSKADPELLQSSYATMRRFAPILATDPNASRAFLQEVATYGKPPSYATLKLLADTEGSVTKTYGGGGNE